MVRSNLNINNLNDVDQAGVRIAVAERSAYDLWLTENIKSAKLVRAKSIDESFSIFQDHDYEALAGLRPKLIDDLEKIEGCKILSDAFTFIKQSIGCKPGNIDAEIIINNFIKTSISNGFLKSLLIKYNVLGKLSLPAN